MNRALPVACLIALLTLSCSDDPAGPAGDPPCRSSVDCELPLQCLDGACRLECRDTVDCAAGQRCFQGACRSRPPTCAIPEDCAPFDEICDRVRNRCVPPGTARCDDDLAPCPAGERCVEGRCQLPGVDRDQGPRPADRGPAQDAGRLPDGGPGLDQAPAPDQALASDQALALDQAPALDQGPDCPRGDRPYGERCLRGSDCASGFCVENKLRGQRLCTSRCDLAAPDPAATCPGIDLCVPAEVQPPTNDCPAPDDLPPPGTIVGVCVGNDTGLPCDFDRPADCLGGACLQPIRAELNPFPWTHPQTVCAAACVNSARCPAGTVCEAVGDQRLCVPAVTRLVSCDGAIDFCGGVCPGVAPEREADVALCLTVPGRAGGYCSCLCASQRDCPQGFACTPFGPDKACVPFAGLRCPAEIAEPGPCQADRQCAAGEICLNQRCQRIQCPSLTCAIDDEDPRLNRCTTGCANDFDCPGDHQCEQFGAAGGFCTARVR